MMTLKSFGYASIACVISFAMFIVNLLIYLFDQSDTSNVYYGIYFLSISLISWVVYRRGKLIENIRPKVKGD